ncbi:uncharacterized protein si:ch73-364h19.1 [Megalops cyprinoides]|uniref:uncharacterized protein si:ch73-364h19.1 n=1 Tax=Megalops cyprinoides TaxID=118141 RepID=UPI0018646CE3|nr:uncharacterized protein si:ch73-364h19.1 [Megalops cyprinoides]
MSTSSTPATVSSSHLTPDQLTIIVASISCLVFFVVILVLLTILYRKDPLCCKVRSYQESHQYSEAPPQYYSSRQTLVGSPYNEQSSEMAYDNMSTEQPGQLFVIGQPSSYHLPSLEVPLPRPPSYESVRKKDRQRQIHMMIADRFGLNAPNITEPPPTYEESIRQSVELSSVSFGSGDAETPIPPAALSSLGTHSTVPPHSESQQNPSTCPESNT